MLGVTLLAFLLMNLRPDASDTALGPKVDTEQRELLRQEFGYGRPFHERYGLYIKSLATLDLGHSWASGEPVAQLLKQTIPISLLVVLPGFVLGNLVGLGLAVLSAMYLGRWPDRIVTAAAIVGMSMSFVVVMLFAQLLLASDVGWRLLPSRGWDVTNVTSYLQYVSLPTLIITIASLGYSVRFYRSTLVQELGQEYVQTARILGASRAAVVWRHVLPNALLPISTRVLFSLPVLLVSGSLLIETYFSIPGVGRVVFDAVAASDLPVLQAVIGLAGLAFAITQYTVNRLYRLVDPRAMRAV